MDQGEQVTLMQILRDFMGASATLSAYLEQDHPLDLLQYHDAGLAHKEGMSDTSSKR